MPSTMSPTGQVMFRSQEKSPTIIFDDGSKVFFQNYHLQTGDPRVVEKLRELMPRIGSYVRELDSNPVEQVVRQDNNIRSENEKLKAEIDRLSAPKRRARKQETKA